MGKTDHPRGLPHSLRLPSQLQPCPQPQGRLPALARSPARCAPSVHKALLEVAAERLALVALDLPVLDGPALQEVVHLRGVDGRRPLLVLGGGLADPVVDVVGQVAARLVDLGRGGVRCARDPGLPQRSPPPCSARDPGPRRPGPQRSPGLWLRTFLWLRGQQLPLGLARPALGKS